MEDNPAAFPWANNAHNTYNWINRGMSLRDYFAAKAMQSLLHAWISSPDCKDDDSWVGDQHLAQEAYVIADAMLRARGR